jgi:hypothetical protein
MSTEKKWSFNIDGISDDSFFFKYDEGANELFDCLFDSKMIISTGILELENSKENVG